MKKLANSLNWLMAWGGSLWLAIEIEELLRPSMVAWLGVIVWAISSAAALLTMAVIYRETNWGIGPWLKQRGLLP